MEKYVPQNAGTCLPNYIPHIRDLKIQPARTPWSENSTSQKSVISKHAWNFVSSYRNPLYLHIFHVYQLFYNPTHHKRTTTTWLNSYFYHRLFHVWGFRPHYFRLAPSNIKTLHTLLGLLRLQSLVCDFTRHAFHKSSHIKTYDLQWLARSVIITHSVQFRT
jgi:hypothetical protein